MASALAADLEGLDISDLDLWEEGPPFGLFARLRREAPVHWSPLAAYPDEAGFWSVTRWEDIHRISRDHATFSSERGGILLLDEPGLPLAVQQQQMISMDPPRHDRIKALFQRGFTPARINEHEDRIRAIVVRALDRVAGDGRCDLVGDVAQPVVSRVIGSFIGTDEADDAKNAERVNMVLAFGDEEISPGFEQVAATIEQAFGEFMEQVQQRRSAPADDLLTVLTHAEIDGERLNDLEIFTGIGLLAAAGNDSTRSTFASGMLALLEHPDQLRLVQRDPSLIPSLVEESLRCFPAFAHFRRTATRDVELHGETIREGDKVLLWYVSSNRDETVIDDPDRFDVRRRPDHQAFGGGGRHFCLGAALARLELRVLFEETLRRFPDIHLDGEPRRTRSCFVNQLKEMPVAFTVA
jgi:cytochrome P450